MKEQNQKVFESGMRYSPLSCEGAFERFDDVPDTEFYQRDRCVPHLDSRALATVEELIGKLIIEDSPHILDLMAGWDSHIPESISPFKVVGLGLNKNELRHNTALSEWVLHDVNAHPRLPFDNETFDVVLNTVSVDYMTRPVEIFREVGRILKPGGLFLVIFSNRFFPQKVVRSWREASEEERVILVEEFFALAQCFEKTDLFVCKGRPRPKDDKYAHMGLPSDPVYAVYAEKTGGDLNRKKRPRVVLPYGEKLTSEELEARKKRIKETLECPHCGERMNKWEVPDNPFGQTWDNDYMYICFNDECPYYVRGWDHMQRQGNLGVTYRLMYNPEKDCCMPVPVPSPRALREGIVKETK